MEKPTTPMRTCSTCVDWTKKGRPRGLRLCRNAALLNNSPEQKEAGTECVFYSGPNYGCMNHRFPGEPFTPEPTGISYSPDGHVERFDDPEEDTEDAEHEETETEIER